MLSFLLRRIVATIPVLIVVALIVFLMTRLAPGDPAASIVGDNASTENLQKVRENLGLNDALPTQFARWGWNVVRGNLGESFFMKKQVTELIAQRIEPTVSLACVTLVLTILI